MPDLLKDYIYWKNQHDKKIRNIISQLKSNKRMTQKERAKGSKNRKMTCVKCNKSPPASFEETATHFEAKCQATRPCSFHIRVRKDHRVSVFDTLSAMERKLYDLTRDLIRVHLDALYSVIPFEQAEALYADIKRELHRTKKSYDSTIALYETQNGRRFEGEIRDLETQVYEEVSKINDLARDVEKHRRDSQNQDINAIIHDTIEPMLRDVNKMRYPVRYVERRHDTAGWIESVALHSFRNDPSTVEINAP